MSENEKLHRELWHWIAKETRKQKRVICKQEWFAKNPYCVDNDCFACGEAIKRRVNNDFQYYRCDYCPLTWETELDDEDVNVPCERKGALYLRWHTVMLLEHNWQEAADLADRIAEMEWR